MKGEIKADPYKFIPEESSIGYWDWDAATNSEYLSPAFTGMLGYAENEMEYTRETWQKLMFPEDLEKLNKNLQAHINSRGAVPFSTVGRFYHKNGSTVHVLCSGRVTAWSDEGVPLRMVGCHIDITASKNTELELGRVKDLLDKTNKAARVGGWDMDLVNNQVFWTDVTKEIHEVPLEYNPTMEEAINFITPETKDLLTQKFYQAVQHGESFHMEMEIITAKGNRIWACTKGYAEFKNGVCTRLYGSFQDITAQKRHEEALKLKNEQLAHFIEYSPAAMAMFDNDMRYLAASKKWHQSYRLGDQPIIGKSHYEVFPETSEYWQKLHQRCLRGESIKCDEESFKRQDGSIEWLRWEIRPWYESPGKIAGMVMLTEVITEQKEAKEALIKAKVAAEKATNEKTLFLSTMSHEIRTPLNAVIGLTNLLLENPRKDQMENLKNLKLSGNNLLGVINDILDFNKIEAGAIKLEQVDFRLKDKLQEICNPLKSLAGEKGVNLNLDLDVRIPDVLTGDPARLTQVLNNLIGNAIKFTPRGHVSLSVTVLDKLDDRAKIEFVIEDTGIGIPPDKLRDIFDSFKQAGSETTRIYGGTGLGLAISKKLLKMMGSDIAVSSEVGQGSAFRFALVLPISDAEQPIINIFKQRNAGTLDGMRILLAEDNPLNVLVARQFLKRWKVTCDVAENGLKAVEMVKAFNYDVVLMDLHMPEMDGFTAVREIRAHKQLTLPIVALTASATITSKDRTDKLGMNGFLTKPFDPEELYSTLLQYKRA